MTAYTTDTFFDGRIRINQYRTGYRFSIDAVLLAHFANPRPGNKVLDLGTGCGVIPLILAHRHPKVALYGVEVQKALADLAISNVRENRQENRITVICTDMKLLKPAMTAGPVDLVVCNPPFRRQGSGRINPDVERAVARHEIRANLCDIIQTAHRMLRTAGRLVLIYTAGRLTDVLSRMRIEDIEPKFIRMIHSRKDSKATLVLIEGVKGSRPDLKIAPPLIIYDRSNDYSEEVASMFRP
ncbi:MAG: tRNA1(Val) (adenine(37)-N6)-methyltransferase [Desulfobacterales bacterium]